MSYQTNPMC